MFSRVSIRKFLELLITFIPCYSVFPIFFCYLCSMTKEERLLHWKTGRAVFSQEEILEVRRLLSKDGDKDESSSRLPSKFIPVGDRVLILGKLYKCVEADRHILTDPCLGCDLASENCSFRVPQCSPFDRRDKKRVWFKLVKQ